jgi:hypothetical protein
MGRLLKFSAAQPFRDRSKIKTKSAVAILITPTKIINAKMISTLKSNNEIH